MEKLPCLYVDGDAAIQQKPALKLEILGICQVWSVWQLWDTVEGPAHTLSSGRPVRPGLIA